MKLLAPIFLLVLALLPTTVLAADPIMASVSNITIDYPDEIVFKTEASSIAGNVTGVTLRTSFSGSNSERGTTVEITPGATVSGEVHYKTGGNNYLVPGADITYWLDVRDSAGNTFSTPKQVFWYRDTRFQWQKIEEGSVAVYYYGNALTGAQAALRAARETQEKVGKTLGIEPRPFRIMLYNTARDIIGAQPIEGSAVRAQELIRVGIAYSAQSLVQVLLSGGSEGTSDTARHEIAHLYVNWVGGTGVPALFNEGLAVWAQSQARDYYGRLERAIATDDLLLLRGLDNYPGKSEENLLAYGQGGSVVTYMIDTFGGDKFRQFLEGHRGSGESTEALLKRIYQMDYNELDAAWRKYIGARPRTYESAAPTEIVMPTIVPLGSSPTGGSSGSSGANSPAGGALPPLLPIVGGALAVVVLAAGGIALFRRKGSSPEQPME